MKFSEVLTALRRWLAGAELPAQVQRDSDDGLWVIFETEYALAELIAGEEAYAPYRFASFTVLDTRRDAAAEPVFCFYDDKSYTIGDILRELDRGVGYIAGL